ncbi:hypothetical protein [Consotaella salsifontis]|uniref:hypothetical protein n=1 Tax=Consotaella salsifontis TaxID=1365950 RepID=UPI0013F64564|nr:hypothetical protein [Consotaella salsifontis]
MSEAQLIPLKASRSAPSDSVLGQTLAVSVARHPRPKAGIHAEAARPAGSSTNCGTIAEAWIPALSREDDAGEKL